MSESEDLILIITACVIIYKGCGAVYLFSKNNQIQLSVLNF